jgi:hypothetical protein
LILIQQHTHDALKIPDVESCTQKARVFVGAIAKMLRGEKAEGRWNTFYDRRDRRGPITMVTQEPMSLTLNGVRTELDA